MNLVLKTSNKLIIPSFSNLSIEIVLSYKNKFLGVKND